MRNIQSRLQKIEQKAGAKEPEVEVIAVGWKGAGFSKADLKLTDAEKKKHKRVYRWVD